MRMLFRFVIFVYFIGVISGLLLGSAVWQPT